MWKKLLLAAVVLAIVFYSLPKAADPANAYATQIQQARRQKNQQFRTAANSPLTPAQKLAFDSLSYFAPAINYRVSAHLRRTAAAPTLALPRNDGGTDAYRAWATADFTLPGQGQPQHVQLLQKVSPAGAQEPLFLPFADATNGHGTYGGGRYLDLPVPADGAEEITLDFNLAYNPYCAYNAGYTCPLPPAQNRLTVPVPAGEQLAPQ